MKFIQYQWEACPYEFRLVIDNNLYFNNQDCGRISWAFERKRVLNVVELTCVN